MKYKFEEKLARLEYKLCDIVTQKENENKKLKSDLLGTTKKLEEAIAQIDRLKLKEGILINDNRGMYIQMSTMATRENEIKGITSSVHQHLDVIMKKINFIEE
ncbi:hypothetical protein CHS0354_024764, partial [Potamilus streckersoni]